MYDAIIYFETNDINIRKGLNDSLKKVVAVRIQRTKSFIWILENMTDEFLGQILQSMRMEDKPSIFKFKNFEKWHSVYKLCLEDLPDLGEFPAIYAFRDEDEKILKYGHAKHFRNRIIRNYFANVGGNGKDSTTQRIHNYLFKENSKRNVHISWIRCESVVEAQCREKAFLYKYRSQNNQKDPPWGR